MMIRQAAAALTLLAVGMIPLFAGDGDTRHTANAGTFGTITVNTPLDADASDFTCTLREAIVAQNSDMGGSGCTASGNGPDRIVFDLGPDPVINISATPMPSVTNIVEIDGGPGKVELRGPVSDLFPGYLAGPAIRISGAAASGSVVRGLAINRFGHGIIITQDAGEVQILGNFLGTDASGTVGSGNYETGIAVQGPNARIGGTNGWQPGGSCTGDCNLFAGHNSGNSNTGLIISSSASGTVVHGNMFSTDPTGLNRIPNLSGIRAAGPESLIGGEAPGEGNLFADRFGIHMDADDAVVQGNYFGMDTTGNALLSEDFSGGVIVDGGVGVLIGGTSSGASNVIATHEGIRVIGGAVNTRIYGNLIGTAPDGTTPLIPGSVDEGSPGITIDGSIGTEVGGIDPGEGNTIAFRGVGVDVLSANGTALANQIRGNSIHSNIGPGIDTRNGGNGEPPPPVITSADQSGATGTATGCPCAIEVYSDDEDEGRIYEGTTQTDLAGNWTFTGSLAGPNVTTIRTDDGGNSSEFSAPFIIDISTPTPTPSPTPTSTPSPTPTPTATPTPTPTPTGAGQQVAWGDNNCSGSADPIDGLLTLRHDAGLPTDTGDCPEMGDEVDVQNASLHLWGDFDCSGLVDPVDALKLLRFDAGLDVARPSSCPDPGEAVMVSSA